MKEGLFRKSSIDRVNSPEQLHDYIQVSSSGVWMTIIGIILILISVCIWGIFGTLESSIDCVLQANGRDGTIYISEESIGKIEVGMPVLVDGKPVGEILSVSAKPVQFDSSTDAYLLHAASQKVGDWSYTAECSLTEEETGVLQADVVTESISPVFFITN